MKTITTTLIFTFLFISKSFAQSYVYLGTSRFDANYTWQFTVNGGWIQGYGNVTFAKRNGGGMLMVSVKEFDGDLKGDLYIYLENGNVIRCIDRNIKDNVNSYTMAIYYLTTSEVEMLKNSNIEDIRFSVYKYPFGLKSYTMSNRYTFFGDRYNYQKNYTAGDVLILMGK